jgi:pterin-4a-carbinolamine dehydratase
VDQQNKKIERAAAAVRFMAAVQAIFGLTAAENTKHHPSIMRHATSEMIHIARQGN